MSTAAHEILEWYDKHRRRLPWRAAPGDYSDPYRVWLSEIMLQQTTVATVKAYFEKFTKLWPAVSDLAAAPQELILKEWAGLGYYARARNLHKCAQIVVREHNGEFPRSEAGLKALPGIGDYTAAAIAAIAFGEPAAVVDGNIERIVTRLNRIETPLPKAKPEIKLHVQEMTPDDRAGDFAQAMMDLGSSICTPKKPECLLCPWISRCDARRRGDMERFPVKPPKKVKPTRRAVSFWVEHDGHVLFERRPESGLLGGMPGFFSTPWIELESIPSHQDAATHAPVAIEWSKSNDIAKHTFTHFHLETQLYIGETEKRANIEHGFWHPIRDLDELGLPTVFKKIAKLHT
jgi:A/G-specific adenine glycosylase